MKTLEELNKPTNHMSKLEIQIEKQISQYNRLRDRRDELESQLASMRDEMANLIIRSPDGKRFKACVVEVRPCKVKAHSRSGYRFVRVS